MDLAALLRKLSLELQVTRAGFVGGLRTRVERSDRSWACTWN